MATKTWVGGTSTAWNLDANWAEGAKPGVSDDVVMSASPTNTTINLTITAASINSLNFTGAGANLITFSGDAALTVAGNITAQSGMTWSHDASAGLTITGTCLFTSNSVVVGDTLVVSGASAVVTLGDNFNNAANLKSVLIARGTFDTSANNYQVDTYKFYDNNNNFAKTLTLRSSVINCLQLSFVAATAPTVTSNNHTINISADGVFNNAFAGQAWGIVNFKSNASAARAHTITFGTGATFVQFNIDQLTDRRDCTISFSGDFSVSDSSTWKSGGAGNDDPTYRLLLKSSTIGTTRTMTVSAASKTITITDVDLQDIKIADTNSPTVTLARVGDCGGNTKTTGGGYIQNVSTPKTVYYDAGTDSTCYFFDIYWKLSGGSVNAANFPLPQDTMIFDNDSWDDTSNTINTHASFRCGNIDASGLTEAQIFSLGSAGSSTIVWFYGSINLSGSGVSVTMNYSNPLYFDARVRNELSATLDISIPVPTGTPGRNWTVDSYGGTVKLASAFFAPVLTLTIGAFDLNGQALTTNLFSSSNANTRSLIDSAGGGKIVINALTGTGVDFGTDTNLTISNAPDIDVGDSDNTLTAAMTLAFGSTAKTFGDLSFKKHAGDFAYIVTGVGHTFGAVTQETPDATYQFNKVMWPADAADNNIASYNVTGHASYPCYIESSTGDTPAHLEDIDAGTNMFAYCSIKDMHVTGGTWDADDGTTTNTSGNEGWTWPSAGGVFLGNIAFHRSIPSFMGALNG